MTVLAFLLFVYCVGVVFTWLDPSWFDTEPVEWDEILDEIDLDGIAEESHHLYRTISQLLMSLVWPMQLADVYARRWLAR